MISHLLSRNLKGYQKIKNEKQTTQIADEQEHGFSSGKPAAASTPFDHPVGLRSAAPLSKPAPRAMQQPIENIISEKEKKLFNTIFAGNFLCDSIWFLLFLMTNCDIKIDAQPRANGITPKASDALSGELWEAKKDRVRKASIYGNLPSWDLQSVIVKSGDDCRKEHLAVQLISHFYDIFHEAGLPLWLRPYEVLCTSSYTALIETIPDTTSLHSSKSRHPNICSLREFFDAKYQENSPSFKLTQRNFVESMAGYSLVCYFLQVKDRHNGNLPLDEEGHPPLILRK
ncbi:hypothetical protein RYX36_028223 [Vicia faba]